MPSTPAPTRPWDGKRQPRPSTSTYCCSNKPVLHRPVEPNEFINHPVVDWAAGQGIYFTRSRPYKKSDQATIESKNNHLVRKYGFYYRYDTAQERAVLNRLWRLVNDRLNYLTPTKKPVGYSTDRAGRPKRLYDTPRTPFERLLAAGVLSPTQIAEMTAYSDRLNPGRDRPPDRQPPGRPAQTRCRQNRADVPRQHPLRPAQRPQRHPRQSILTPPWLRGHYSMRHGQRFAGILT